MDVQKSCHSAVFFWHLPIQTYCGDGIGQEGDDYCDVVISAHLFREKNPTEL